MNELPKHAIDLVANEDLLDGSTIEAVVFDRDYYNYVTLYLNSPIYGSVALQIRAPKVHVVNGPEQKTPLSFEYEEPLGAGDSDPRPDPRKYPEFWTE